MTSSNPTPPGKQLGAIQKFFAVLGGANPRILALVPETAFRFAEIAMVLIGTAVIAGLSMAFALTSGMKLDLWVAIPLAVVWAVIILNLDRFLTSQMKSSRNWGKLIAAALPRVALAAIIGVIVAVPMTIKIFQSEIDAEVARMGRAASAELIRELEQSELTVSRDAQQQRVEQLRVEASGAGAEAGADPRIEAIKGKEARAKADWEQAEELATQAELLFQCDRYGDEAARAKLDDPSKCSPKSGPNGLAAQFERDAKQLREQANGLKVIHEETRKELSEIEGAVAGEAAATTSQRKAEAEAALPDALEELSRLDGLVREEADAARAKIDGADGLLAQIEALNSLSKSPAMGAAHYAVMLLFFVIELLPVIVKIFSSYGDPSAYEVVEENEKKRLTSQSRILREREVQRVEGEAQRDLAVEADMLAREKALGVQANQFVEAQMGQVVKASLERWADEIQTHGSGLEAPVQPPRPGDLMGAGANGATLRPGQPWSGTGQQGHPTRGVPATFNPYNAPSATARVSPLPSGAPSHAAATHYAPRSYAATTVKPNSPSVQPMVGLDDVYSIDEAPHEVARSGSVPRQQSQRDGMLRSDFVQMSRDDI